MGIAQQHSNKFNLYDIFANFLPGAVLLVGLLFPYVGVDGLFIGLNAGGLIVTLVFSFATGLFVQAVGGNIQSSGRDFANHIQNVDRYRSVADEQRDAIDVDSDINISTLDAYFVETFRAELGLTSDFDDWGRLHKLVLAKLEATSRTRALRLQALFLAMRGVSVAMMLLAIWFVMYMVFALVDVFPVAVPVWTLPYLSCLGVGAASVLYQRGGEFSRDVAKYMIIEYYLEILGRQGRPVELDFLDADPEERTANTASETETESGSSDTPTEGQFEQARAQLVTENEEQMHANDGDVEDERKSER